MTLNLTIPEDDELKPRITVFGVGGAGGNAVNNMIEKLLEGVDFVVANTDAQALQSSRSDARIQMGVKVTGGLGAGARPEVGTAAAEETIEDIVDHLAGAHMCFITAGMGGGTGTGAAPIIAQAARELGVLAVGVVTTPFQFEGTKRMRQAEDGVEALQRVVDTLIIIPNQNLFRLANEKTTFTEAFSMADDVLYQGVKGVTDLMVRPGLINLDFADVRAVMDEMGKAMMGTGEAEGADRAVKAAEKAIANPLLDEISLKGARGVLINITGGYDMTLFELDEAANRIREEVDPEANIIVGSTLDTDMENAMRVSVVATGIDASLSAGDAPMPRRVTAASAEQEAEAEPLRAVEPSLFAEMEQAGDTFEPARETLAEVEGGDAGLPPPAYRPQQDEDAAAAAAAAMADTGAAEFAASRAPSPGTPSPETLARLQAAVRKAPNEPLRASAAASSQRPVASAPEGDEQRPRFAINKLINRMTGQPQEAMRRQQPTLRQQPKVQSYDDDAETDSEQERIECPAFLRRQAN